jgi:hypothetical protein
MKKGFVFACLALVALWGCHPSAGKGQKESPLGLSAEGVGGPFRGIIAQATTGRVSVKTRIAIRFAREVPGASSGMIVNPKVLAFSPPVGGLLNWTDGYTLVFEPFKPLPVDTSFHGMLKLEELSPDFRTFPVFGFDFSTAPNEVDDTTFEWQPAVAGDPENVILSARVTLAAAVPVERLAPLLALKDGKGNSVALSVRQEGVNPVYFAVSAPVKRPPDITKFAFTVGKNLLGTGSDLWREVLLQPVRSMAVEDWKIVQDEDRLGVQAAFNEAFREGTDYSAFVRISPPVQVQVTAQGKTLLITGNFRRETSYVLELQPGIANVWGGKTEGVVRKDLVFSDMKPAVKFAEAGAFLPTSLDRKLAFQTMNLKKARLSIFKVFPGNLGQFLQVNALEDKDEWPFNEMERVGEEIVGKELVFSTQKNAWGLQQLELDDLLAKEPRGLFLVGFSFQKKDIDFTCKSAEDGSDEEGGRYNYRDYYEDPCSEGYYYRNNKVFKAVLVSDIGLLGVQEKERMVVYAANVQTARPFPGVKISLYSFQNQVLASGTTDAEGKVVFDKRVGNLLMAEKDDQRSVLKFASDRLSMDAFPVEGVTASTSSGGVRAFMYSERGVYRPGDPVYLTAILREGVNQLPLQVPVRLKVFNPLQQVVLDEVNSKAVDGMMTWTVPTQVQDPTGMWEARLFIGEETVGLYPFRVETIAPPRIKAELKTGAPAYSMGDKTVGLTLDSQYLFGAPAADLKYDLKAEIVSFLPSFESFRTFTFAHEGKKFKGETKEIGEGNLDAQGHAEASFTVPDYPDLPAGLQLTFRAQVFEKGGRPVSTSARALYHPGPAYVGLDRSNLSYNKTGTAYKVPVIVTDPQGRPLDGRRLGVKIFQNEEFWWWDYGTRGESFLRYKSDSNTRLLRSAEIVSRKEPVLVDFNPAEQGQYLIEVRDLAGGHEAGVFTYASPWGGEAGMGKGGAHLSMQADKEKYRPRDTARVTVHTPEQGSMLVSVVKGDVLLSSKWVTLSDTTTSVSIPITSEMAPNVYVFAAAVQPHAQTRNDRPLRAYGVLNLSVEEPESRIPIEIRVPDELKPDGELEVRLQAQDGKAATATVAVVDEGLLFLTRFVTPDPWGWFYSKMALGASFFDIFDSFMGLTPGQILQTFKVGGDMGEGRGKRMPPEINRFPPVALFQGPVALDSKGAAVLKFKLPHYMGEVRVMAVACRGRAYGSAEKSVKVKEDVVVLSTLPRVAGPGENFVMPVSVFATKDGVGKVTLSVETNNLLQLMGERKQTAEFTGLEEKTLLFTLKAMEKTGVAEVTLSARWGRGETVEKTSFSVRPIYPFVSQSIEKSVDNRGELKMEVPAFGLEGTRKATLNLWRTKPVPIEKRLNWLIHYPYGCIEQTTSSVFPQLYLKDIIAASPTIKDKAWLQTKVDQNVNAGISRLVTFALPDGAFTYWPGAREKADEWSNLYAGHFLIEAKRLGYHTPYILDRWLDYESRRALFEDRDWRTKAYRLYLLAMAGRPDMSAMNLVQENYMGQMDTVSKFLLASAYKQAGADDLARQVKRGLNYEVAAKNPGWDWCFGSTLGDLGIFLNVAVLFGENSEASRLADLVNTQLKSNTWWSTHALSWSLTGMGRFIQATWKKDVPLKGEVLLPDGRSMPIFGDEVRISIPLQDAGGKSVTIESQMDATMFVELVYEGIPLTLPFPLEQKGISLAVEYFTEAGAPVNPKSIAKGTTFYAHFTVKPAVDLRYVALTQIFPSGWEIVNLRMTGEALPEWTGKYPVNSNISYQDIRDDRILWFMNRTTGGSEYHFFAKLVTVTQGSFTLPPTYAEAMYDHDYFAYFGQDPVEVR